MKSRLLAVALACLLAPAVQAASTLSLSEKALLQASMQSHIDGTSIEGRYPYLNVAQGQVSLLRQRQAHPLILRMGEYFILCSDFEAPGGDSVNIDFFLAPRDGGGYVVFDRQVQNRALVMRLMKAGKVESAN